VSRENLELVRRIYDAVARRDSVTPFEHYAEDIVWDFSNTQRAALYAKSVYVGHDGVREMWRETVAAFGNVDFELDDLMASGEHVLAVVRDRVVGRASGVAVEATHFAVWTVAHGKVVRLQVFDERERALDAAGFPAEGL
jgi:ketosteroid isomerase-like protein